MRFQTRKGVGYGWTGVRALDESTVRASERGVSAVQALRLGAWRRTGAVRAHARCGLELLLAVGLMQRK